MNAKVGRNDPCPCGGGKKYKHCCLQKPQPALLEYSAEVRERAFDVLFEFSSREQFVPLREGMLLMFFTPELDDLPAGQRRTVLENETCMANFLYWFIFEASLEGPSGTLVNRFLSRKAHTLPLLERRYLEAMRGSHLRLYEVEDVRLDEGLRLRDCWDGTRYDVRERSATHHVVTHAVVALRLRPEPDGTMVIDGPGFNGLTNADKDAILSALDAEWEAVQATDGDADGRFAFYQAPVIAQHVAFNMLLRPAPRLATSSGDPMSFCKVFFEVIDIQASRAALERIGGIVRGNDDDYVWLRGKNDIVHASIRFEDAKLVAETHSAKRATAVRKLLQRHLGNAVRYRRTEEQDLQTALAEYRASRRAPDEPQEREIPREIEEQILAEYEEQHYRSWLDTPLPALANKSPREAARLRAARSVLAGLLKDFTASSERKRRNGQYAYDFSWMWQELGIDPKDSMNRRTPRPRTKPIAQSGATAESDETIRSADTR